MAGMSKQMTFGSRTGATVFYTIALFVASLAGCDNGQPAGNAPTAPPTAAPSPTTTGTDVNAAVPMDDAAAQPATTFPAGGAPVAGPDAPADATLPAGDAPAKDDAAGADGAGERQSVGGLSFMAPAGWRMTEGNPMRLATLTDGQVELAITSFPGDVGGRLANVNRWRQQAGLPAIAEAELPKETRTIEVDGREVLLVDAAGAETRLLAASIPGDGKLFFAKLTGPADKVGASTDVFEAFVKSIKVE